MRAVQRATRSPQGPAESLQAVTDDLLRVVVPCSLRGCSLLSVLLVVLLVLLLLLLLLLQYRPVLLAKVRGLRLVARRRVRAQQLQQRALLSLGERGDELRGQAGVLQLQQVPPSGTALGREPWATS